MPTFLDVMGDIHVLNYPNQYNCNLQTNYITFETFSLLIWLFELMDLSIGKHWGSKAHTYVIYALVHCAFN
jgi:hypothetical protein